MKKSSLICSITVQNKKYEYRIEKIHDESTYLECKEAAIAREFLNDDIAQVIFSLPKLILTHKKNEYRSKQTIRFRVTGEEKQRLEQKAVDRGYRTLTAMIKDAVFLF